MPTDRTTRADRRFWTVPKRTGSQEYTLQEALRPSTLVLEMRQVRTPPVLCTYRCAATGHVLHSMLNL